MIVVNLEEHLGMIAGRDAMPLIPNFGKKFFLLKVCYFTNFLLHYTIVVFLFLLKGNFLVG